MYNLCKQKIIILVTFKHYLDNILSMTVFFLNPILTIIYIYKNIDKS